MNVFVLNAEFPSSAWRRSFADALIRLRPDMNPDAADELSDTAYLRFTDLEPVEAALLCSQGRGGASGLGQPSPASQLRQASLAG